MKSWVKATVFLNILLSFSAEATLEDKVIIEGIEISPNESYQLSIKSAAPTRLGVFIDDTTPCKTDCISVLENKSSIEHKTRNNLFSKFMPEAGVINVQFKNIIESPVKISVHQYIKKCDSEACTFLNSLGIKEPLNFGRSHGVYKRLRMSSISRIETSSDGSWSNVSGKTVFGNSFKVTIIWWLYDPSREISCGKGKYIQSYKKKMERGDGPTLIAGKLVRRDQLIFMDIDTCTGRDSAVPRGLDDF